MCTLFRTVRRPSEAVELTDGLGRPSYGKLKANAGNHHVSHDEKTEQTGNEPFPAAVHHEEKPRQDDGRSTDKTPAAACLFPPVYLSTRATYRPSISDNVTNSSVIVSSAP